MFASVLSAVVLGLDVRPIQVEADVSDGLPGFTMVGFPSAQVREAQDRVRTAMKNNGFRLPPKKVTVNFSPADIKKEGAGFDMPVAAAVLAAGGMIDEPDLKDIMIYGELGLDGEVHATAGILPRVLKARELGCRFCIVPWQNLREASLVPDIRTYGIASLREMAERLRHPDQPVRILPPGTGRIIVETGKDPQEGSVGAGDAPAPPPQAVSAMASSVEKPDFCDIQGQERTRRAAEIAAGGFHNLLMIGPPGSGKTMIARRMPTILPALSFEEKLELTRIYSIAGLLSEDTPLIEERPFRSPHHTSTSASLAGGGRIPKPGEITLAHKGVLFLDEMPEFSREALEILRQPLEDHCICVSRTGGTFVFPAGFMLVAAMNPCPCGFYPDLSKCRCTPGMVSRYLGKISQPLLDRIDLCTEVGAISIRQIQDTRPGECSSDIRSRVLEARKIQESRYRDEGIRYNAQLQGRQISRFCPTDDEAARLLDAAYERFGLSARSYHRILKVARTIADLDRSEEIRGRHMAEALSYRAFDKQYWNRS